MKKSLVLVTTLSVLSFTACRDAGDGAMAETLKTELVAAQAALAAAQSELETLKAADEVQLIHIVYFNIKPDLSEEALTAFKKEVDRLAAIDQVKFFKFGPFEDLGDPRALSNYKMVMEMGFNSKEDYMAYQEDPVHLAVKELTMTYLAGPPATYDFRPQYSGGD